MSYLHTLNKKLEKFMPFLTPTAVLLGILLATWLKSYTYLVPWIFAGITFTGSLNSNLRNLTRVILHPLPLIFCMLMLHVILPLLALTTGKIVFPGDTMTITGMLLAFAIPTGIVSLMWVSMYKGNVVLTLSIILIDTFLSPFVVPYTMHLIVGVNVAIDTIGMMKGLLWMVVLPSIVGMFLNQWTKGTVKEWLGKPLSPFSKIGLGVVVAINTSVVAPYLKQFNTKVLVIFVTVLCVSAFSYVLGWVIAKLMKWDHSIVVALTFNCGMRNNSAGAVLATTYFPGAVAMPVILCTIFQQILASFASQLFRSSTESEVPRTSGAEIAPSTEGSRVSG